MERGSFLRRLFRDSGSTASSSQFGQDGERANICLRQFPLRADLPPPQISGVDVQHVDSRLETWRADDGAIWLRDRLPHLLAEKKIQARILSFEYDAEFVFTKTIKYIERLARDLLNQIDSIRTTTEQKRAPIIFVAHSLGGLVVKTALNKAWAENVLYQNIVDTAAGCVFLSVPHGDADLARWAYNSATIVTALTGVNTWRLPRAVLESFDEWKKVDQGFVYRAANMFIANCYETLPIYSLIVVNRGTAALGLVGERITGLLSDHCDISKYGDSPYESNRFSPLGNYVIWVAESALKRGQ